MTPLTKQQHLHNCITLYKDRYSVGNVNQVVETQPVNILVQWQLRIGVIPKMKFSLNWLSLPLGPHWIP